VIVEASYRHLEQFAEEMESFKAEIQPLLKSEVLYEGRYDDGKKIGKGDFLYENGDFYRGNFDRDMKDGFGILISFSKNFIYKGEFKQDQIKGQGICIHSNKMIIDGYYSGVRN